jgi:L-amino acid N-acyltransferase YncA
MTNGDGMRMIRPMQTRGTVRKARPSDCEAIARIYNEGIAERRSTFETEPRSAADIEEWLAASPDHPVLVAERGNAVLGWARISPYSSRPCYAGVGEGSVYVRAAERSQGLGNALATALSDEAERAGFHKIVGKLFADNEASRRLVARCGFREVGTHLRHGHTDDGWRDVLVVERLLRGAAGSNASDSPTRSRRARRLHVSFVRPSEALSGCHTGKHGPLRPAFQATRGDRLVGRG